MIKITENFTGYPDGKKRQFAIGETPADLPEEYKTLLVAKGHAQHVETHGRAPRKETAK